MGGAAVVVRNVSKRYQVFENQRTRLMQAFWPRTRPGVTDVWALQDIGFEIARGESVAVIGRNGGGKSTLLQILTGVLAPTSGEVRVNGRVSALLELGSGFNPEYTGRDNVVMNGLLLGLTRVQIAARFSQILAFAEIGEAIDRPVKTYSSGMMMRLAFAVQAFTDPEILIVDEALSVGDFFFQQKCFRYIRGLTEKGVTLLFVSHDMGTVRDLCSRAIYLRQGRLAFVGDTRTAIREYLSDTPAESAGSATQRPPPANEASDPLGIDALWRRSADDDGRPLLAVEVADRTGRSTMQVRMGDKLQVRVYFQAESSQAGHVTLALKNRYDQVVTSVGSHVLGMPALSSEGALFAVLRFELDMMLEAGLYSLNVAFARLAGTNKGELLDETGWIGPVQVCWDYEAEPAPFLGMFGIPVVGGLSLETGTTGKGPSRP